MQPGRYILQVKSFIRVSSLVHAPSPHPSHLTLTMKGITKAFARYVLSVLRDSCFGPFQVYNAAS